MAEITPAKAQTILTALRGVDQTVQGANSIEYIAGVSVNAFGQIFYFYNAHNFKQIGLILSDERFQIGELKFDF
jgi:hypothetical protein